MGPGVAGRPALERAVAHALGRAATPGQGALERQAQAADKSARSGARYRGHGAPHPASGSGVAGQRHCLTDTPPKSQRRQMGWPDGTFVTAARTAWAIGSFPACWRRRHGPWSMPTTPITAPLWPARSCASGTASIWPRKLRAWPVRGHSGLAGTPGLLRVMWSRISRDVTPAGGDSTEWRIAPARVVIGIPSSFWVVRMCPKCESLDATPMSMGPGRDCSPPEPVASFFSASSTYATTRCVDSISRRSPVKRSSARRGLRHHRVAKLRTTGPAVFPTRSTRPPCIALAAAAATMHSHLEKAKDSDLMIDGKNAEDFTRYWSGVIDVLWVRP